MPRCKYCWGSKVSAWVQRTISSTLQWLSLWIHECRGGKTTAGIVCAVEGNLQLIVPKHRTPNDSHNLIIQISKIILRLYIIFNSVAESNKSQRGHKVSALRSFRKQELCENPSIDSCLGSEFIKHTRHRARLLPLKVNSGHRWTAWQEKSPQSSQHSH